MSKLIDVGAELRSLLPALKGSTQGAAVEFALEVLTERNALRRPVDVARVDALLARAESGTPAPVKHPDTVRLDWLENRGLCFRHADRLADETGDDRWADWIVHPDTEFAFADTRAAIDAAMGGAK